MNPLRNARRQGGAALVMVLVLSMIMIGAGLVALAGARTELKIAHNDLAARQALAIAEAGLHHAYALVAADTADGLADEFGDAAGGGLAGLGEPLELTENGSSVAYRCRRFGIGAEDRYCVRAFDNHDETGGSDDPGADVDSSILLAVQVQRGRATRTVQLQLGLSLGPDCAILTQGNLQIGGNPTVTGRKGCAHSNAQLRINGHPELERGATASSTMDISGSPTLEGTRLASTSLRDAYDSSHQQRPTIAIPSVRPMRFGPSGIELWREVAGHPDGYRLDADGQVYVGPGYAGPGGPGGDWSCDEASADCSGGRVIADAHSGDWQHWRHADASSQQPRGRWSVSGGGLPAEGVFFVEGAVRIGASPGDDSDPWDVTLVALDSIAISGNPTMQPFVRGGSSKLRNTLLVSGNDVELSGSPANLYSGGIFAHQQIKLTGNPRLQGFIVAEDGASTWSGDPAPLCASPDNLLCDPHFGNAISGDPEIHYDGLSTPLYDDRLRRLAWNDVR